MAQQQYSLGFMVVGGQAQACTAFSPFTRQPGDASVTQRHTAVTPVVPLSSTMARLSLVALLALAFSGVAFAAPPASQEIVAVDDVHTTSSWSYSVCGTLVFASETQPIDANGVT